MYQVTHSFQLRFSGPFPRPCRTFRSTTTSLYSRNSGSPSGHSDSSLDYGRTLPNAELLQPTMDPQLPHYVPKYTNLNGTRALGSTSDMVGVINDWIRE